MSSTTSAQKSPCTASNNTRSTRQPSKTTSVARRGRLSCPQQPVSPPQWRPANANAGLSAWYLSMYLHKEAWGRLGFFGYDLQDQCGATNVFSCRSDEGAIDELRGPNYPNYAMNVGHQGGYAGYRRCTALRPRRRVGSKPADQDLLRGQEPRLRLHGAEEGVRRGAIREFMPAGERTLVIPAK